MIFHLAEGDLWATGEKYLPASLRDEGFIHCSTAAQLIRVANTMYAGRTDLVIVTIDPEVLDAPVVWEDCYETGERFPHIYGSISGAAVVAVADFRPDRHGAFSWANTQGIGG